MLNPLGRLPLPAHPGARAVDGADARRTATSCSRGAAARRERATSWWSRWATRPGQLSVKRAARPDGDGWCVVGDNPSGLDRLARARARRRCTGSSGGGCGLGRGGWRPRSWLAGA